MLECTRALSCRSGAAGTQPIRAAASAANRTPGLVRQGVERQDSRGTDDVEVRQRKILRDAEDKAHPVGLQCACNKGSVRFTFAHLDAAYAT